MELLTRSLTWESEAVLSVELVDPDGAELPGWTPGAHLDLQVGPVERQYSLCGDPADRFRYRVAVLRETHSRGGSSWVHTELRPGQTVRSGLPRNKFELDEAEQYLFIGGGIGITPLLPMIAVVADRGADWRLVYGGRTRASMAFVEELAAYGERVRLWPEDNRGMIQLDQELGASPQALVYCCGPEPLLSAVEQRCKGVRELRVERFSPKVLSYDELAARGPNGAFEVVLHQSGQTFTVEPEATILGTLESHGVAVPSSCQEGTCGTCETAVLEGVPDHRDSILDEEDRERNETMMICVGRSCSPTLVLDL